VVVVSSEIQCVQARYPDVHAVLLSSQVDMAGENDVKVYKGDGGVGSDSIAQGDVLFTLAKQDLIPSRWRGRVQADTLVLIRAVVAKVLGIV